MHFYPRSPCGERRVAVWLRLRSRGLFLSTFPLRGTSFSPPSASWRRRISIHVPLAGNVLHLTPHVGADSLISIHVPLAGNVLNLTGSITFGDLFLSTFPLRGTSVGEVTGTLADALFLSTFPLRGTSASYYTRLRRYAHFYPRSPCGERPPFSTLPMLERSPFLSTFPLRGTSAIAADNVAIRHISIHVPLAGNVPLKSLGFLTLVISIHVPLAGNVGADRGRAVRGQRDFYPRSPCGERPSFMSITSLRGAFLSTFPLRGTSKLFYDIYSSALISIHVPLAGNVEVTCPYGTQEMDFYPRSPCGERRRLADALQFTDGISIHVPLAGNVRLRGRGLLGRDRHFYPRSPCGERRISAPPV